MSLDVESERPFAPPVARRVPARQAVTFPLKRAAFLQAAETVIPRLIHPATGQAWEYDGYRRTQLFLMQPPNRGLGLPEHTVEFELEFGESQTVVAVSSDSPAVQQLFNQFTREVALFLLQSQFQHGHLHLAEVNWPGAG